MTSYFHGTYSTGGIDLVREQATDKLKSSEENQGQYSLNQVVNTGVGHVVVNSE